MAKKYLKRIFDDELEEVLDMIGAVLIVGPKWCGKTTTAEQHAKSVLKLQDPDNRENYLKTADIKPSLLLKGEKPRLIDEWQVAPVLWDAVRTSVDELEGDGLYILTGSTSVDESKIMHSGTGRIHRLLMRPMSLFESGESNGKISILDLFKNPNLNIDGIESELTIEELIYASCRGGWPESLNKKNKKGELFVAKSYLQNICESDVSTVDGIKKDPKKVKALLHSYSRNISTLTKNTTILNDIKSNNEDISEPTFYSYMDALKRLFVIDEIPAWSPNIRSKTAIRTSYKKAVIDPSIAVAALNLSPESLLEDLNTFGFIFENLCVRDLSVYTSSEGGMVHHYRDRDGLEVDCVLKLENEDYALIEFKLGSREIEEGARHLLELEDLILKKGKKTPKFLAIVTGGKFAYTREDRVKILPIGTLR